MHLHAPSLLSFALAATAQHTFNLTQAYAPENFGKYHCLTFAKVNAWLPSCLHTCHAKANAADGCALEDYTCHCVNYQVYSDAIESCAFPPSLGGNGTCTLKDLEKVRPVVNGMCNFLNTTLYAGYHGCNVTLRKGKTYAILAEQESIAVGWPYSIAGNATYRNVTYGNVTYGNATYGKTTCGNATHGAKAYVKASVTP